MPEGSPADIRMRQLQDGYSYTIADGAMKITQRQVRRGSMSARGSAPHARDGAALDRSRP
jgi:hypothetical protein